MIFSLSYSLCVCVCGGGGAYLAHFMANCEYFILYWTRDFQTGTLANSEDPDEMPLNAAFNQGLHCLLR